jgi:hypothetical protein
MTAWRFLFISLLVHLIFWLGVAHLPTHEPESKKIVEIELIDKNTMRLSHAKKLKTLNMTKLEPRFWGEENQSVEKETKAKNLGYLNPSTQTKGEKKEDNKDDLGPKKLNELAKDLLNVNASDISDFPDINDGLVTALNTERFVYFSFFQRVDQRITNLWIQKLKEYENRWTPSDIQRLAGKNWITYLEVLLDSKGNYVKSVLHRSSGVGPIDTAASDSFLDAGMFPNPPSAMIQSDGYIHLKYAFRFTVEARQIASP